MPNCQLQRESWCFRFADYYISILKRAAENENLNFLVQERDELLIAEDDGCKSAYSLLKFFIFYSISGTKSQTYTTYKLNYRMAT